MRKHTINILPFFVLFALLGLLAIELFFNKPNELPSPLLGEEVPNFHLPNLFRPQNEVTQKDLMGRVALLNVWATWCYACGIEHDMLLTISKKYHVPIYGIIYKDDREKAIDWLVEKGNPYALVGDDQTGDVAINLGVYGTPETFIISPQGKIVYRHVGAIDKKVWDEVLYPIIKQYGA